MDHWLFVLAWGISVVGFVSSLACWWRQYRKAESRRQFWLRDWATTMLGLSVFGLLGTGFLFVFSAGAVMGWWEAKL